MRCYEEKQQGTHVLTILVVDLDMANLCDELESFRASCSLLPPLLISMQAWFLYSTSTGLVACSTLSYSVPTILSKYPWHECTCVYLYSKPSSMARALYIHKWFLVRVDSTYFPIAFLSHHCISRIRSRYLPVSFMEDQLPRLLQYFPSPKSYHIHQRQQQPSLGLFFSPCLY